MRIDFEPTGSAEELDRRLRTMQAHEDVKSLLVMSADANGFTPEQVDPLLRALEVPVFGGTFPEIIYDRRKLDRGSIVLGLPHRARVEIIPGLSDADADFEASIDERLSSESPAKTMFVFVDAFATRIANLIESLFGVFGLEPNYIGGGAGSLSFEPKPCLFTNEGLRYDCAVLALTDIDSGVGVNHGWTTVSGPYQVTRSQGNTIHTLDSTPALDVYRRVVEERTGQTLTREGFFELAKGFPFGISKLGAEKVVRDPIATGDDGSLVCVGEVPQGSFVDILTSDTDTLVQAARGALDRGRVAFPAGGREQATLFIDCISRVLVLGDDFDREIDAVHRDDVPLVGALTLGEIANSGKNYLEFYNKTCVVSVLG